MENNQSILEQKSIMAGNELADITTYKYSAEVLQLEKAKLHQASVLCFPVDQPNKLVIFLDDKNRPNIPGGRLEPGETPEQAAIREVMEESNCTVIGELIPLAYTKWHFLKSGSEHILVWYKANVQVNEGQIADPDGEAQERVLLDISEIENTFGNGGKVLTVFNLI